MLERIRLPGEEKIMETHIDPVCGARVEQQQAAAESEYLTRKYYFCSAGCKHKFDQRPEDYVIRGGQSQQVEPDLQA